MFFKRARQRPRCDMRGAACNHLNQCTYTLYHSIIIYTRCTARTVSRRYFIRKDSQRLFVFPDIPIDLVSLPRSNPRFVFKCIVVRLTLDAMLIRRVCMLRMEWRKFFFLLFLLCFFLPFILFFNTKFSFLIKEKSTSLTFVSKLRSM